MKPLSIRNLARFSARLVRDSKAATAVEYGLILALMVLALIVGLRLLGEANMGVWGNINDKVRAAS